MTLNEFMWPPRMAPCILYLDQLTNTPSVIASTNKLTFTNSGYATTSPKTCRMLVDMSHNFFSEKIFHEIFHENNYVLKARPRKQRMNVLGEFKANDDLIQ